MIDKVLLGDNPFIGVSHLSQEDSREKSASIDAEKIAGVMDSAFSSGAQGLICSAHPNIKNALAYLKAQNYEREFGIGLIVPDAQSYVRTASEKGMLGLMNETFGKLSLGGKMKVAVGGGMSALTLDPLRMMNTYLNMESSIFSSVIPSEAKLDSIFLHELLTELIVSFKLKQLAESYINHVCDSLHIVPGFVTRNFEKFVGFALDASLPIDKIRIMTPFNKAGFQMNPTRQACEEVISKIPSANIIAMSILASGYLRLEDAIEYLKKLPVSVSCVVGVSTESHAKETFSRLRSNLLTSIA